MSNQPLLSTTHTEEVVPLVRSPQLTRRSSLFPEPGSIGGSIFNLAGATLGAGALALPYAFAVSGICFALSQLLVASVLTIYTIRLLIRVSDVTGLSSYEDLAVFLYGKKFAFAVQLNILIFCFGLSIAYAVTIGDIFTPVGHMLFPNTLLASRAMLMTLFTVTIAFPLSLLRNMRSLTTASTLGVGSILLLVAAVSYKASALLWTQGLAPGLVWTLDLSHGSHVLLGVPIVMFAFTCQVNVFAIYAELRRPSRARMTTVVDRAIGLSVLVYLVIGLSAYLALGPSLMDPIHKGNILLSFPTDDPLIVCTRAAISFTVAVAYPLNIFPCRFTLEHMFFTNRAPSQLRHVLMTATLVFSSLLVAILCPSINVVFGIIGGTCSALVCFCLPAAFTIHVSEKTKECSSRMTSSLLGPWMLLIGASLMGIISTIVTVRANFY